MAAPQELLALKTVQAVFPTKDGELHRRANNEKYLHSRQC